jgi:type I restriction enzyme S subunit
MNNWQNVKLEKLIDIKHGFAFRGNLFSDIDNVNVILTPGNFKIGGGFKIDFNKTKFYTTNDFPKEYILQQDDLVVSMTDLSKFGDTLGFPLLVPKIGKYKFLHNQRLGLVQILSNDINKKFLYWLMRTNKYQQTIVNGATGSTVKHTSPTRICDYEFLLPSLPEQHAIADLLGSLDDKIEANNTQNKTLEAIASVLFKSWFVDFEPFGGVMPKEWKKKPLGDIIKIVYGKGLPSDLLQPTGYPVFGGNGQIGFYEKYLYEEPHVIISCRGAASGKVLHSLKQSYVTNNSLVCEIQDMSIINRFYLEISLKLIDMTRFATGSAQPQITVENIVNVPLLIPDKNIMTKYNEIAKTIDDKISYNDEQSHTLSQIRDTLLPRLMSGKIRIPPFDKEDKQL